MTKDKKPKSNLWDVKICDSDNFNWVEYSSNGFDSSVGHIISTNHNGENSTWAIVADGKTKRFVMRLI